MNLKSNTPIYPPSKEIISSSILLLKDHGINLQKIQYLGKGEGSKLYLIESDKGKLCLKLALFQRRTKKVLNEAKIRQKFISYGLDFIPSPLFVDEDYFLKGAVVYDFIEGYQCPFNSLPHITQFAQILAKIHSIDTKICLNGYEQIIKQKFFLEEVISNLNIKFPELLNDEIKFAFSLALKEYKKKLRENHEIFHLGVSSWLHGDLSNNSIIDNDGKIWLIDWENSEYGDTFNEIFGFLYDRDIPSDFHNIFFETYQNNLPHSLSTNFNRIKQFYWMLYPLFNICWGLDQLAMNIKYKLEPNRKLNDLYDTASDWERFYSRRTVKIIKAGIAKLRI